MVLVRAFAIAAAVALCAAAQAAVTGFTANPTGNSSDWTTFITGVGQTPNTNVNFNTHPAGPLIGAFYTGTDGVTLLYSGGAGTVATGSGAPTGSLTPPLSPGEGPLGTASYLQVQSTFSLVVSFAAPVYGAGIMTADYYNPSSVNTMTLEAFSGPNATGTSLGTFAAAGFNFQLNNLYFMGVADTSASIGSIQLSGPGGFSDGLFVDTVYYTQVPEPGTALLVLACALLAATRRAN